MNSDESINLLWHCINDPASNVTFDGRSIRFLTGDNSQAQIKAACDVLVLPSEFNLNGIVEIRIDSPKNGLVCFYNEGDFCNRSIPHLQNFDESHLLIWCYKDHALQKKIGEAFESSKAIFFNFYYYHKILSFLEKQEHFMSFYSRSDFRIVLFTSEKGPFDIVFDLHEERVKNLENLAAVYDSLEKDFQKIDFVQFFKAAVINTIHEYSVKERFFHLVQSLRVILNVALRDHYIYIRNFDFDKVKTKFREERNKYFEALEKNIDSIKSQVTSFPLTFAASIFAGYQVKEKPAILILIFLGYALYTFIAWRILSVTKFNLDNTRLDVENEESKINTSYDVLKEEFAPDFIKIKNKITKIESIIYALRSVLIGLLLCFVIFSFYEMFLTSKSIASPIEVRVVK